MDDEEEETSSLNEEPSEAEDLLLSETDDAEAPILDLQDVTLKIDYNARLITHEVMCENGGDDCNMHFVDKDRLLGHLGSESGVHTSTEDLNLSDDDKSNNVSSMKSVNLDGLVSTSGKKTTGSLSTMNYSHTVFKNEYSIDECDLDEVSNNMEKNCIRKDNQKTLLPGLTVAGLPSGVKLASSIILPTTHKALNTLNVKNVFTSSLLLDEDVNDAQDEQDSPPMTCLEFLKSELSDGNNTDAEDISVGSLDDLGEISKKERKTKKGSNTCDGNDKRFLCPGDSRRSSTTLTEDELFSMENIPGHCQKRVKKRNFRISDKKEASDGSGTDEEML